MLNIEYLSKPRSIIIYDGYDADRIYVGLSNTHFGKKKIIKHESIRQ